MYLQPIGGGFVQKGRLKMLKNRVHEPGREQTRSWARDWGGPLEVAISFVFPETDKKAEAWSRTDVSVDIGWDLTLGHGDSSIRSISGGCLVFLKRKFALEPLEVEEEKEGKVLGRWRVQCGHGWPEYS